VTRRRRVLGPYAGKTLVTMWRSLRMLVIVIIAAGSGLFLIQSVNEARHRTDEERSNAFIIDERLIDPAQAGLLDHPALAMEGAVKAILKRPGEKRSFDSREALVAALLPHVTRSPHYPTVTAVLARRQEGIRKIEDAIGAAREDGPKRDEVRRRDFAIDELRFELAALAERQREFVASAIDHLDAALAARPKQGAKQAIPFATFADSSHPLHVVYEAMFYLAFIVVALAVSYCAATVLKLLPYPGAAEKWSSKMEETFSAERGSGPKSSSPVASVLLTTTVLGVGLLAASDPLHEQPGSPFFNARLASLLPDSRNERSGAEAAAAGDLSVTVKTPPYPSLSPTFEFNPVNPVTVNPPAFNPVIQPATIEGFENLKSNVEQMTAQAAATREVLVKLQEILETESGRAQQLQQLITDARTDWSTIGTKIDTAGAQLRNSIVAVNFNGEQRHLLAARQEATAGARSAWRGLLMLGRYQVNTTTAAVFETEPCDNDPALHAALRDALRKMEAELPAPLYQMPFETTLVERMVGRETLKKDGPAFKAARAEVWRHLPVLLETSRIAERGIRK
jgi:hypothetical protein